MKTSELSGAALDYAVAKCEPDDTLSVYFDEDTGEPLCHDDWTDNQEYKPSTNWAQGGAIIEREAITILSVDDYEWCAAIGELYYEDNSPRSPTPLIAAMRCYVASKLGDDVEIPGELSC